MSYEIDGVDSVIYSPVCARCRRFTGTKPRERTCEAFPDGIPAEIWLGDNDHTEAYEGDGGKQFLPRLGVRPKPGDTARFSGSMTVVSGEDTRTPDDVRKAARVYLNQGEEPPKGVQVKVGPRGGRYYEADPRAHPDQFHKVVRTPKPDLPEDLKGKTWLDPHKDNPYPRESYDHHTWIREHEKEFLRNPYDRRRDPVNFSKWLSRVHGIDSRYAYNANMEEWESSSRAEDYLETIGIPKDHEWATKIIPYSMENPGLLELHRFLNMSRDERMKRKEAGEPVPMSYDPTLDTNEYDAISYYCGYGYEEIKATLRPDSELDEDVRRTKAGMDDAARKKVAMAVKRMDEVIARERIPIDCDVFHGLTSLRWMKGAEIVPGSPVDLHPGDLLRDESFTSWSMDPWTSYHFAGGGPDMKGTGRYPAVIRIKNPKGLPGIYVGGGEQEIILPRGASYRVTAVDEVAVHPRTGWNVQYKKRPDNPVLKWHVITVEPVLEDDQDRVQKGERIYVTPNHPAPRGVTLHRGPAGGVFYFGERGDAKPAGGSGPQAGPPATPSPRGRPNKPPAAGGSREEGGPRKDLARSQSRFHRRPEGEGVEVEFHTIEELRTTLAETRFGLISAGRNPKREADEPEETFAKRHEQLRADLAALGYVYTQVLGSYGEFEDSFLVMAHDADRDPLVELGRKYNQDSIIWTDRGTNYMIYTTDSTDDDGNPIAAGSYLKGKGFEEISLEEGDFFTEVYLKESGANARFSLNFEWGDLHPPEEER